MKIRRRAAWACSTLVTCLWGTAHAGPRVWASMGEDAYRLLRRAGAEVDRVELHAVPVQAPVAEGGSRLATHDETIYLMRVDPAALPRLSLDVHERLHRCGGYIVHSSRTDGREALAGFKKAAAPLGKVSYAIDNVDQVNALLPQLQESQVRASIVNLSTQYKNRFYTTTGGVNASNDLAQAWKQLAGGRSDVTVKQFTHPNWPQKSVILTIKGTTRPKEIVVIGGHLDSTIGNTSENSIAPGADDDASGVSSLQEVARVLLSSGYQPRRTLQFIAYAAEEVGLLGSAAIAADYKARAKKVVGAMQLDMTNYQGGTSDYTIITDYTNAAQNDFVKKLAAFYVPTMVVNQGACGYACSDHASWTRNGYAASFPFESLLSQDNPYIHTPQDTIDKSGNTANHAIKFSRLALAYAVELGSDGPAPVAATTAPLRK
jgi:bacterial leucyl aminopeptidase